MCHCRHHKRQCRDVNNKHWFNSAVGKCSCILCAVPFHIAQRIFEESANLLVVDELFCQFASLKCLRSTFISRWESPTHKKTSNENGVVIKFGAEVKPAKEKHQGKFNFFLLACSSAHLRKDERAPPNGTYNAWLQLCTNMYLISYQQPPGTTGWWRVTMDYMSLMWSSNDYYFTGHFHRLQARINLNPQLGIYWDAVLVPFEFE